MSSTPNPQSTDSKGFVDFDEYQFSGDSETVIKKRKVVEGYRLKASFYHAAQYAGCARASIYRWMEADPLFAEALADSHEDSADIMETSVYERAFTDNLLAMFWLKAHRPKFRDKVTIDVEVVKNEIQERINQLGLRQLPMTTTEFIDVGASQAQAAESLQFSPQPEDLQKEGG
jgi:hypothetical protein